MWKIDVINVDIIIIIIIIMSYVLQCNVMWCDLKKKKKKKKPGTKLKSYLSICEKNCNFTLVLSLEKNDGSEW